MWLEGKSASSNLWPSAGIYVWWLTAPPCGSMWHHNNPLYILKLAVWLMASGCSSVTNNMMDSCYCTNLMIYGVCKAYALFCFFISSGFNLLACLVSAWVDGCFIVLVHFDKLVTPWLSHPCCIIVEFLTLGANLFCLIVVIQLWHHHCPLFCLALFICW